MTAAFAPAPAPAPWPNATRPRSAWRFGREIDGVLQWVLPRNCSLTPYQLLAACAVLCGVSLLIATAFWLQGAPAVIVFAGLETAALGAAIVVFARHAADRETITLRGHALAVEHRCGAEVSRADFRAEWVRVEPTAGEGSLVELSGGGQSACVGRYLPAGQRADLARELRAALRGQRDGAGR